MLTTHPFDDDKLREECGVFGIWGADHASSFVALGLHALQHRGQEAAGITSFDGEHFHSHRAMGHVAGNFDRDEVMRMLAGRAAIGHVRYSTAGGPGIRYDSHVYANYYVPPHYDSLIGKLIAYGDTREQAIARMRVALSEMVIEGIQTNIALHQELMNDAAFIRGGVSIHYLEEKIAALKSIQAEA